jgi:hypothetical protein
VRPQRSGSFSRVRPALIAAGLLHCLACEAAPSKTPDAGPRTGNPVSYALWNVTNYDIYQVPVIVQVVYSRKKEQSVLLFPVEDERENKQREDWRIEVAFLQNDWTKARVTTRGKIKAADADKAALGRAVVAAIDRLSQEGLLGHNVPGILSAGQKDEHFWVTLTRLPEQLGGVVYVKLSPDLQQSSVIRGQ